MSRARAAAHNTEAAERDLVARDSYRSMTALSILIVLWVAVLELFGLPFPPLFRALRATLAIASLVALAYGVATWRRPRMRVAVMVTIVGIVAVVVFIPWATSLAAQLGERWEPVATLQLGMAAVPLISPFGWLAYVLLGVFASELVLVELYQQHVGLGPLVGAEPWGSLTVAVAALAVLVLRKERQQLGLAYIRTESEAAAVSRLGPLLATIHCELEQALASLDSIGHRADTKLDVFFRSLKRLSVLSDQLEALRTPPPGPDRCEERQLLAHDAHTGAFIFALAGLAVIMMAAWSTRSLPVGIAPVLILCIAIGYGAMVLWLWATRDHPTIRRGVLASVLLIVSAEVLAVYMHIHWVRLSEPVFPFIGAKLMLMILVLLRFPRLWIGAMLFALILITHVIIQLIFATQLIPLEPWHMLVFVLIGLGFLAMGEQRRIASIELLRAETVKHVLQRHAHLSLALCDQLNTPLQTLVGLVATLPSSALTEEATSQIDRLHALSRQVAKLAEDLPPELQRGALDSTVALTPARYRWST